METLASKNPSYASSISCGGDSIAPTTLTAAELDADLEMTYEKLEAEAREVETSFYFTNPSFSLNLYSCLKEFILLHYIGESGII